MKRHVYAYNKGIDTQSVRNINIKLGNNDYIDHR